MACQKICKGNVWHCVNNTSGRQKKTRIFNDIEKAIINIEPEKCEELLRSGKYNNAITLLFKFATKVGSHECMKIINDYRKQLKQMWDEDKVERLWEPFFSPNNCDQCKFRAFEVLLKSDLPDINKLDKNGIPLLLHICKFYKTEYMTLLLNHKNEIKLNLNIERLCPESNTSGDFFDHFTMRRSGSTALIYSASLSDFPIVQQLLNAGADPNYHGIGNTFPLHYAIFHNNFDIVKLLLQYEADVNQLGSILTIDRDNLLPLSVLYLCTHNFEEETNKKILCILLKKNPILKENMGYTTDQWHMKNYIFYKNMPSFYNMLCAAGISKMHFSEILGNKKRQLVKMKCLKSLCRKTIREQLATCFPKRTIFETVNTLTNFPFLLKRYLLYDVLFDDDNE